METVARYNVVARFVRYFGIIAGGRAAITSIKARRPSRGPLANRGKKVSLSPPAR